MRIAKDCIFSLQFNLSNDAGQVLESYPAESPLVCRQGAPGSLPVLEQALLGKSAGEHFSVTVRPEHGFGERRADLVQTVPRAHWPATTELAVGGLVERVDDSGTKRAFVISAIGADSVTLDGNHPLAGMTLHFEGTVVDVRPPAAGEKATG